jgi:antitoxin VapB
LTTARLFWSGRSQAVRLPREFRFRGKEVRLRRHGSAVILEPVPEDWRWLDEIAGTIDPEVFAAAAEPTQQNRPALDWE